MAFGPHSTNSYRYRYVTLTIDGGGSAITTGNKGWWMCDVSGRIIEWVLLADTSGSITIDIWKDNFNNFPPTVGDTITGNSKPNLSSQQRSHSSNLTDWTVLVDRDDVLMFNVDSVSTVQRVTLTLKIEC